MIRCSRTILLSILMVLVGVPAFAAPEHWAIDPSHSDVRFKIRHMISRVTGGFDTFSGEVEMDSENPTTGSVMFEIDAASINTNNDDRDNHLKSKDFFNVEEYPKISFKSKAVKKKGDELMVSGDLTMRGVTKPIDLTVLLGGVAVDPWGNQKAGFEVNGKLNRKEWGIVWNKDLDKGGTLLGDDVTIMINIEAAKMKEKMKEESPDQ